MEISGRSAVNPPDSIFAHINPRGDVFVAISLQRFAEFRQRLLLIFTSLQLKTTTFFVPDFSRNPKVSRVIFLQHFIPDFILFLYQHLLSILL